MQGWLTSLLVIFVGLGAWSCQPREVARQKAPPITVGQEFTTAQMQEDLDFLWTTLADVHPDLLHQVPADWWEHTKAQITADLPDVGTRIDFFRLAAPAITALGDGHTGIRLPEAEWAAYLAGAGTLPPIQLGFAQGQIQLLQSYVPDAAGYEGAAITAINGVDAAELRRAMLAFVPGERMAFREMILSQRSWELLWLATGWEGPFELELADKEEPLILPAISHAEWAEQQTNRAGVLDDVAKTPVPFSYTLWPEVSAAFLDFRSFSDRGAFSDFLTAMFTELREQDIKHLFIDIRHNGGGNSQLGDDLLDYLTDRPYRQFSQIDVKVSRQIKDHYSGWPALRLRPVGTIMEIEGRFTSPGENPLRFSGEVYLLTSSYTFSSAASFAAAFKDAEVGLILGDETGGLLRTFGDVYQFWLPNTGLQVGVSHKRFVSPGDDPEGVRPHIYTPWAALNGPELQEAVRAWLEH